MKRLFRCFHSLFHNFFHLTMATIAFAYDSSMIPSVTAYLVDKTNVSELPETSHL